MAANRLTFFALVASLGYFVVCSPCSTADDISTPSVDIQVVSRLVNNHIETNEVYVFRISCDNEVCTLTKWPLDECTSHIGLSRKYRRARVFQASTSQGNLKLLSFSENMLDMSVFEWAHKVYPAHVSIAFVPELPVATKVMSFVAERFVDSSLITRKLPDGIESIQTISFVTIPDSQNLGKIACPKSQ